MLYIEKLILKKTKFENKINTNKQIMKTNNDLPYNIIRIIKCLLQAHTSTFMRHEV